MNLVENLTLILSDIDIATETLLQLEKKSWKNYFQQQVRKN